MFPRGSHTITILGIQHKNKKNSIKSKNNPKDKTLRGLKKLEIDLMSYSYKPKCTVQWAEEHIGKDVRIVRTLREDQPLRTV